MDRLKYSYLDQELVGLLLGKRASGLLNHVNIASLHILSSVPTTDHRLKTSRTWGMVIASTVWGRGGILSEDNGRIDRWNGWPCLLALNEARNVRHLCDDMIALNHSADLYYYTVHTAKGRGSDDSQIGAEALNIRLTASDAVPTISPTGRKDSLVGFVLHLSRVGSLSNLRD